ncbi:hypothetical protein [Paraburkholderia unamae]|uniref:Uncharacterized protein n=1 Tax=Paraburkholderia unamae TaxID=219649 RepID=A0ACC6RGM2_9BURK
MATIESDEWLALHSYDMYDTSERDANPAFRMKMASLLDGKVVALFPVAGSFKPGVLTERGFGVDTYCLEGYAEACKHTWEQDRVHVVSQDELLHLLAERMRDAFIEVLSDRVGA